MPTPFPAEFRADVIAVARKGEAPLRQIAKDFGISEACLHRWLKIADREDGAGRPASAATSEDVAAQLREAHNWPAPSASARCPSSSTPPRCVTAGRGLPPVWLTPDL